MILMNEAENFSKNEAKFLTLIKGPFMRASKGIIGNFLAKD